MREKWKIYVLTFFTYAIIHSIRTAWSSIKPILNKSPYLFSSLYLGQLDMTVLLALAFGLNLFGWVASKWKVKYFLLIGMILLAINEFFLSFMLFESVNSQASYIFVYGLIGLLSCTGWPACFYIISKYFSKKDGIVLCLWNSSSQLGDFLALIISYIIIDDTTDRNILAGKVIIVTTIFLVLFIVIDWFFLNPKANTVPTPPVPPPQQNQQKEDNLVQEVVQPKQQNVKVPQEVKAGNSLLKPEGDATQSEGSQKQSGNYHSPNIVTSNTSNNPPNSENVTFLNVWCLPSVTPLVIVFSLIKAVNSIIVNWLVFYLALVELRRQASIITIAWSFSIVIGGVLGAYVNKALDKKFFIGALFICSILFIGLQQMHVNPNTFSVLLLILLCGLLFGGPYNLMGTAVPLMLGESEEIRNRKGAIAAIISVMEGGAQLVGAVFMIIIPSVGVVQMHWVPAILCLISAAILTVEQIKKIRKQQKQNKQIQIKISLQKQQKQLKQIKQ